MRVLLVWYDIPNRPELLEPFKKISDNIEFIHLAHNTPKKGKTADSFFKMIYWFDYLTPYQLIREIKPDKIFSEFPIDLKSVALRIAAKNQNIPYIGMAHGIYSNDSFDIKISNGNSIYQLNRLKTFFKIIIFYFSIFNMKNRKTVVDLFKYFLFFINGGSFNAAKKIKFNDRNPDKYIIFQIKNAYDIVSIISNISQTKLHPIGVPFFDDLFQAFNKADILNNKSYYLMIDTAWIYQSLLPSSELINNTYIKLAEYCKKNNSILKVKLHPHWYNKHDLPQHPNIEYIKNVESKELNSLLTNAQGCFLYFSTLSMPLIAFKKCYFLYFNSMNEEIKSLSEKGNVKTLNVEKFNISDIDFTKFEQNDANLNEFVKDYLYSTDGQAVERLKQILLN